jgi:exodeoxyribonuclease VII small subunit
MSNITKDIKDIKFESAIERLEDIVEKLESGEIELEQALVLFEEGMELSKICSQKLDEAKKKIQILKDGADGEKKLEDFDTENYKD